MSRAVNNTRSDLEVDDLKIAIMMIMAEDVPRCGVGDDWMQHLRCADEATYSSEGVAFSPPMAFYGGNTRLRPPSCLSTTSPSLSLPCLT